MKKIWWKTGVIYQIYPRSFRDTNGDGVGDLQGIIDSLDYLNDGTRHSLGVDAIWLSPVYPSPQADFGYDVSDYCNIDPLFGTLDTFQTLVDEAHKRGIRIIMDLVFNHTSDQHPWFKESRSSTDNSRRDWYIWHPGKNRKPPNNWASYFGGPAWRWDQKTSQYYLAMFDPSQPDLNWRNPEVREELYDVIRFWLDRGVDGFRMDVYNQFFKDEQNRSNPFNLNPLGLIHGFWGQKHIYDRDQPEMFTVLKEMRAIIDSYPERMFLGETSDEGQYLKALEYYGENDDGLHLAFNFDFLSSKWSADHFRQAIIKWETNLPDWAWPTYVLSNHDVDRHFSRYERGTEGMDRAMIAAAMLLTLRGTPTLYYGEEIGQSDIYLSRKQILDPPGKRYWPIYKGRDACRAPMQWDQSPRAGFTSGDPWLPVNTDYRLKNVETQTAEPNSLFNFYRHLIWLRHQTEALHSGELELINNWHRKVLAYYRYTAQQRLLILLNFSSRDQAISLDRDSSWSVIFGTHCENNVTFDDQHFELNGYEVLILNDDGFEAEVSGG